MSAKPLAISNRATTAAVLALLEDLDWRSARVCDVGAGRGHFSHALGEELRRAHGLPPAEHVFPCDLLPDGFEYDALECRRTGADGRLPYEDETFDATVSIEVIEHVEDQFGFLRELARVTKPEGRVIVTTPNTLHMTSRLRNLLWGFPTLYDPLPLSEQDVRYLGGHIHPISPYFLAYGALRAGLAAPRFAMDRAKRSARAWAVAFAPLLWLSRRAHLRRMERKRPDLLQENRALLDMLGTRELLTSRTAVLCARKPVAPVAAG